MYTIKHIPTLVAATVLLAAAFHAAAQGNPYCPGLKNPTNFNTFNAYSGASGEKIVQAPNPANPSAIGITFNATYNNTQLADALSNATSDNCAPGVPNPNKHFRIMAASEGTGYDKNVGGTLLPYVPNSTFTHSIRVGNCYTQKEAEALYYTMDVGFNNALLYLYFAPVIEAPGHGMAEDPTFIIRVAVQNPISQAWEYNVIHGDSSCYMIPSTNAQNNVNHWHQVGSGYNALFYRDWQMASLSLLDYIGQKIRIEVMIADCSQSGHYGYTYFAGNCSRMAITVNGCANGGTDTVALAAAPKGMNSYQWYRSKEGVITNTDLSNYILIPNANDSVLAVRSDDFISVTDQDTMQQNTFLCKLTTYMDPSKPLTSVITTTVNNMKPTIYVDSSFECNNVVTLVDRSKVIYNANDEINNVDTSQTTWQFFDSDWPAGAPAHTATGGTAQYQFGISGVHSAVIRTKTFATSPECWATDTVKIRSFSPVKPQIALSDQNICAGDSVQIVDRTPGAIYHRWVLMKNNVVTLDTVTATAVLTMRPYDTVTQVTLYSHNAVVFYNDTNLDGIEDAIYCIGRTDTVINVQQYPKIVITGDNVICKGQMTNVLASCSNVAGCTFAWYEVKGGQTVVADGPSLRISLDATHDKTFWVKATSPFGCVAWDSVTLMLVDPKLSVDKPSICVGDTVTLTASHAATYEWSCNPNDDASFWGQENNAVVVVSPKHSTTYTLVGKGSNGCGATELTQKITVYDYPIPTVGLTPGFIDSENPSVQFNDLSPNGTHSLWNFGNGETSTIRSVVHTFKNLDEDSILISLRSCNPLGCCNDTSFYVLVGNFSVWYPNAFTPRLESNNTFHVHTNNKLVDYELYIYNRRGALVFHSVDPAEGWDGTYEGKPCPQGSYVWISTFKRDDGSSRVLSRKGTVTLLR
ncbi:MAG: gliding motility-associated C-terminal domain-containing protein [Bacteroidales bacterium]|nr:gliding motility-associated C-terminal domain-containing protein [Bacteroidales bacterium]